MSDPHHSEEHEPQERADRLKKVERLRELGINPYPYRYDRSHSIREARTAAESLIDEGTKVRLAGKIYAVRLHGGALFADIADASGKMQLYFKKDELGEELFDRAANFLDSADYVGAEGKLFTTHRGELSLLVEKYELLSKALRPLPSQFYGLKDVEKRYRQRYLDLLVNEGVREIFRKRTAIVDAMRGNLNARGYLEIETPTLHPVYGGANARPFKTRYEALDRDYFLRISNELYLKRAIIGNLEKVYEFSRDFRNEGIDATHNPEFTMLEIYEAYRDYHDYMDLTRELILAANAAAGNGGEIAWGELKINLAGEWPRVSMKELFRKHADLDIESSAEELRSYAVKHGLDVPKNATWGVLVDEIFSAKVEPNLLDPVFVTDYPVDISPLAKRHRDNEKFTERFELYIAGREMANGFSELNDPVDQRERFESQERNKDAGDEEAHPVDEDFIIAQEYGMPPTAGVGIGIDRLTMLLTNSENIREVILFPQLRS